MDPVYWFLIIGGLVFFFVRAPGEKRGRRKKRRFDADSMGVGGYDGGGD